LTAAAYGITVVDGGEEDGGRERWREVDGGFRSEVAGRRRRGTNLFFVVSLSHVLFYSNLILFFYF